MACLERCMQGLFPNERDLIINYYRQEGCEKIRTTVKMAGEMGITSGSLRVRAFRVRQQLARCVARCMEAPDSL